MVDLKKLEHPKRVYRLIKDAVRRMSLDLSGLTVLTEAASGVYVVTSLAAALAGAKVIAVTKNSRHGTVRQVSDYTRACASDLGVSGRIEVSDRSSREFAARADIVTNLGFVRPIDRNFLRNSKPGQVVSLTFETWEFRKEDVDIEFCRKRGIPVLGTRETGNDLNIFRYIGRIAVKLLHECDIEVFKSRVMVLGGGHFGREIMEALQRMECEVVRVSPGNGRVKLSAANRKFLNACDAVIVAEHTTRHTVIGGPTGIPIKWLAGRDIQILHLCGVLDEKGLRAAGLKKHPALSVPPGHMVTTIDYVGPRPVIELNTAALKVGEAMWRGFQKYGNVRDCVAYALKHSPAMDF